MHRSKDAEECKLSVTTRTASVGGYSGGGGGDDDGGGYCSTFDVSALNGCATRRFMLVSHAANFLPHKKTFAPIYVDKHKGIDFTREM
jgi:hypothetical protein